MFREKDVNQVEQLVSGTLCGGLLDGLFFGHLVYDRHAHQDSLDVADSEDLIIVSDQERRLRM